MIQLLGTSITDKIYNTAISRQYTPEAAAAIAASIAFPPAFKVLIAVSVANGLGVAAIAFPP